MDKVRVPSREHEDSVVVWIVLKRAFINSLDSCCKAQPGFWLNFVVTAVFTFIFSKIEQELN